MHSSKHDTSQLFREDQEQPYYSESDGDELNKQVQLQQQDEVLNSSEQSKLKSITVYLGNRYGQDLNAKILWIKNKFGDFNIQKRYFENLDEFFNNLAFQSQLKSFISKMSKEKSETRQFYEKVFLQYIENCNHLSAKEKENIKQDTNEKYHHFKYDKEDFKQQLKEKYEKLYQLAKKSFKEKRQLKQGTQKQQPTQGNQSKNMNFNHSYIHINNSNQKNMNQNLSEYDYQQKKIKLDEKIQSNNNTQQMKERNTSTDLMQKTTEKQQIIVLKSEQIKKLETKLQSMTALRKKLQNEYNKIKKQCIELCESFKSLDTENLENLRVTQLSFDNALHQYQQKYKQPLNFQKPPSYQNNQIAYQQQYPILKNQQAFKPI
ncbi:hypothetical protein TTHERM_00312530 (macronuclear) [Tetrahymena thermophila SB210]|uniref:Uncharacterized protein n=1 Tax=Tetrahymena thermophila (strain SB210) TaxID=312017 RepID=Q22KM8_TETTS|nr:hypothetical protein TTHERM_00312530 [Tetrahymena thermophila SB210]EAR85771.4 hypothetical protein TTHERM_00312530 [Tetrahymena thermophila SB210]|eukprot:XP_001033434.4 hypothetical protein TTHERM_00312530 [Tetrahymena thermophila SB210]